jgi:hypothetical protein
VHPSVNHQFFNAKGIFQCFLERITFFTLAKSRATDKQQHDKGILSDHRLAQRIRFAGAQDNIPGTIYQALNLKPLPENN